MRVWNRLLRVLRQEEGWRSHPYMCSEDRETVGIGSRTPITDEQREMFCIPQNWREVGLQEWQGEELLKWRMHRLWVRMRNRAPHGIEIDALPDGVQVAIGSCIYQMGVDGFLKFVKTWGFIRERRWAEAADEMLNSDWAREQTPQRAKRMAELVRG